MTHLATLAHCLTFRCGVINVACQSAWLIVCTGAPGCGVPPQLGHFAKRLNQQLREHKSNSRVEPGQAGGPGWSRVQCWDERARLTGDGVADDASAAGAAAAAAAAASAVAVGCRAHCR